MRICYHCGRITSGRPLFCNWCGRSYHVRLCPRLHPNPRGSDACKVCGSRDLSLPHERLPLWFKILVLLSGILPGIALAALSLIYIWYFLTRLFWSPSALLVPMLYGLLLCLTWFVWMHIPFVLVRILKRQRNRR